MKRMFIASLFLTCALALTASAQTPPPHSEIEGIPGASRTRTTPDPIKESLRSAMIFASREGSLTGRIVAINATENSLIVEQEKSGRRFNIPLNPKTKLKADKQTELAGIKSLSITDFKLGQPVKVIYTPGPTVIEVRLRRKKN